MLGLAYGMYWTRIDAVLNWAFGWMAWTLPTGLFFVGIALALVAMGVWEAVSPGGGPRDGILGLRTTRGDRLFISLLGSAFIHLLWLAFLGEPLLWVATIIAVVYAVLVFWRV